jgi:hypothetical protein
MRWLRNYRGWRRRSNNRDRNNRDWCSNDRHRRDNILIRLQRPETNIVAQKVQLAIDEFKLLLG